MIWPSSTSTLVSIERTLVVGPWIRLAVDCTTDDDSWKICIFTSPPSVICGFTRSVMPTSLRSKVWNGVTEAAPPVWA
ncbi:hypothetical protein D9M72_328390 [compost metagenome]